MGTPLWIMLEALWLDVFLTQTERDMCITCLNSRPKSKPMVRRQIISAL